MLPKLLISDKNGKIFSHPELEAAGMEAGNFFELKPAGLIRLPPASQLFNLPHRIPIGLDNKKKIVQVDGYSAVAAFFPPGYTVTCNSAYRESAGHKILPLYSYAACAFQEGEIYASGLRVDRDKRHDPRFIDMRLVKMKTKAFKKIFTKNRLIPHLERCALVYGCPNAQNFFLSRCEAPLPTSPECNSNCAGCISYQPAPEICPSQPRINFIPAPSEISEIALYHIKNVKDAIVSFGQGCEGEPLLAAGIIERGIKLIRRKTCKGIINMNTNASKPAMLARLFDAGLDSIRVSVNSVRPVYYKRYYRPSGYAYSDVTRSIRIAKSKGRFVSLNYLTMPGFTNLIDEVAALKKFVRNHKIDMIQWRNLNYDPLLYFRKLRIKVSPSELIGVKEAIESIRKEFPQLKMGYFNPVPLGTSCLGYRASPRGAASRRR
jgi:pyruvate-formate lyase-activating enzyme